MNIEELGKEIENAFEQRDSEMLRRSILLGEAMETALENEPDEKMVLYYFLGNAWSDLDGIENYGKADIWSYNRVEHINAIKYYRKAVAVSNTSHEMFENIGIQAYTNLGNMFSEAGRVIFAIESWKKALEIGPDFGMARCNLGRGLLHYAIGMYDEVHKALLLRYSHNQLKRYIGHPSVNIQARAAFTADRDWIGKVLTPEYLDAETMFRVFSLGRGRRERDYKSWVLKNSLFLNPLNDVYFESAVAHDVLQLPNMRVRDYKAPVFQGFFNQMKQEYISARFFFFQYLEELPEHKVHFSDTGRKLVNTLDYTQHGVRYETLKNSFRMLYSIFDKVAYFINEYFELGVDRKKVNFRTIWFDHKKVRPELESLKNNSLRGLYFLSKEFYDEDGDYLASTDPDSKNMSEVRNNIEHKYFKIHWLSIPTPSDELRFDPIAYSVAEEDLVQKVLRLLRSARESLIYLSLAVHIEEKKKDDGGIAMPLYLADYD